MHMHYENVPIGSINFFIFFYNENFIKSIEFPATRSKEVIPSSKAIKKVRYFTNWRNSEFDLYQFRKMVKWLRFLLQKPIIVIMQNYYAPCHGMFSGFPWNFISIFYSNRFVESSIPSKILNYITI